jgi:hypothetical protein
MELVRTALIMAYTSIYCERLCAVYICRAHCHTLPCALRHPIALGCVHCRTQSCALPHTAAHCCTLLPHIHRCTLPHTAIHHQGHCHTLSSAVCAHYHALCHKLPLGLPHTAAHCRTLPHTAGLPHTAALPDSRTTHHIHAIHSYIHSIHQHINTFIYE